MKSKILKILGVALTLAMVFSLGAVLIATPVAADEDEWDAYALPEQAADGDYIIDATIAGGPGPIARDIDGYFWAYVDLAGDEIVKSTDTEGRAWDITDFSTDVPAADWDADTTVVAIVCSSIDEDIVYVATRDINTEDHNQVYKTEDGGDEWEVVSDLGNNFTGTGTAEATTCLTVGYVDDEAHAYVGTDDQAVIKGDVYYINDIAFGGAWTDLDVNAEADGDLAAIVADLSEVFAIAASPDFDNDGLVAVIATDGTDTYAATNEGAAIGTWDALQLEQDDLGLIPDTSQAAIVFPEDFDADDAYEYFAGLNADCHDTVGDRGGVYRIYGNEDAEEELLDDLADDVVSLSLIGDVGDTYLLAGTDDGNVWYSSDDGDNWDDAETEGIEPSGDGDVHVICGEDIADDGIGWAAVAGTQAGVSLTMDGGAVWVGTSLMDTDIDNIHDMAVSPTWDADEMVFVATDNTAAADELWRFDGTNWERVMEDIQYGTDIDLVDFAPEDAEAVFIADTTSNEIWLSEDGGNLFEAARQEPGSIASWLIVDSETIIVGGIDDNVFITDIQGRRAWDEYDVEGAGADNIVSLAAIGDIVIAGSDDSEVFISEDFGETWDLVGAAVDTQNAWVAFDPGYGADNNTIYAAADATMARFLDTSDLDEDWEVFTADGANAFATADASGIAVASDGTIYVSDGGAADVTNGDEGGVQRTVNPLDDVDAVEDTEFDIVLGGLADADEADILYINESTTQLWIADLDVQDGAIWVYEDVMAAPATGGEADPDEDSVGLTWDGFDNATDYEVRVYSDEDMGLAYAWHDALTGDDDPVLNVSDGNTTGINADDPLDAGTQYWWQARAAAPVFSRWSDVWTFTTLPATMTIDADQFGPAVGATGVPAMPSFGWELIVEADHYVFELADNPDFTTPIVSTTTTNPVFQLDAALDYDTNYFWRVKAISGTSEGNWATGTFTTMAEPVVAPAPPPPAEAPTITIPPTQQIAPNYIYAIIGIGAALAVVVIVLIVRTRKP